ncbi:MAG: hypothetical protein KGI25_01145 [Thaumarchaeota archaeon]|nr:hypothetical protein [Nitrososphaerota archaeon]
MTVINDSQRSTEIIATLANSAKYEVLLLLTQSKSMVRLYKLGIFDKLFEASKGNIKIRIICPINSENDDLIKYLHTNYPRINILNGTEGEIGLIIVDNSKFFIYEERRW